MATIKLENIEMKYDNNYILKSFNLTINHGELLVLLGESGCGKSTLLKIIAGIIMPNQGMIKADDLDISHYPPQLRKIGYVPQAQILFPHMTVFENIAFGLKARKLSEIQINENIDNISHITQIEELLDRFPSELSGGQKQKVALARALAIKPDILLLDEPLSSIDAINRESLSLIIRQIQQTTQTTVLYVTHNQEEARLIADNIAILYDGKIQQFGNLREMISYPKNYKIARILNFPNIWPINNYTIVDNNSLFDTPLGKIKINIEKPENKTGFQIDSSNLKLKLLEIEKVDFTPQNFTIEGIILNIIYKSENKFQILIQSVENPKEYIKFYGEESIEYYNKLKKKPIVLSIPINKIIFF